METGNLSGLGIDPVIHGQTMKWAVVGAAYLVTILFSGLVVRLLVGKGSNPPDTTTPEAEPARRGAGRIIGKCENILTVTFILLGQETGLALIIGAKSIVRSDQMRRDPQYYLGGTLVNLVWGMFVGLVARVLIAGL